ncbi:phage major capsid protein [Hyphomonas sp.]|uniref:phage major capsid protein n=1 Tax=Hyphomonas sp. TaxID=87 RepID=UPI00391D8774
MKRLPELQNARAAKVAEMRSLQQTADAANRPLADNEAQRFDTLETEVRNLDNEIQRAQRLDALERATPSTPGTGLADLDRAASEFRVGAFIAHMAGIPGGPDVAQELEVSREYQKRSGNAEGHTIPFAALFPRMERRTISYGGGSGNGAGLVFEQEIPDGIPALRAALITAGLGARVIDGLVGGGPVSMSKITAGKTAEWLVENAAGTPADPTTAKVTLSPKFAMALTSMSKSMLVQTSPAAQALVTADILASVSGAIDEAALVGGGTAEPEGVWDQISPTALGEPTWAEILSVIEATEIANTPNARAGWAMHPSAIRKLRSTPRYIFGSPPSDGMGGFIMEAARSCADYPVAVSTAVPTTGSPPSAAGLIYSSDWQQLVIGVWESVNLMVNPYSEAEFRRGSVAIRATATVDVALRYDEAFQTRTIAI